MENNTRIAIARFPHRGDAPTHRVVGTRADGYLRIRPLNIPDHVVYTDEMPGCQRARSGTRFLIETHIPPTDVTTF